MKIETMSISVLQKVVSSNKHHELSVKGDLHLLAIFIFLKDGLIQDMYQSQNPK